MTYPHYYLAARLVFWSMTGMTAHAMANDGTPGIWSEVSHTAQLWTIVPHITAPSGRVFRYDMTANKTGPAGSASIHQAGQAIVGADGTATLSSLQISLGAAESCRIDTRLLEDGQVVATETLSLPR